MSPFKQVYNNLKEFLNYLTSIWGLLSIFTSLFPLITILSKEIPPPKNSPNVLVTLASLSCLFIIFYKFTHRTEGQKSEETQKNFFTAIGCTLFYLIVLPKICKFQLYNKVKSEFIGFLNDSIEIIMSLGEATLYIAIFFFFSKSFTTLAVIALQEEVKRKGRRY